jgi:hypothetical protein
MRDQVLNRLAELETEFREGQQHLSDLESRESDLRARLLRISGAIHVLREIVAKCPEPKAASPVNSESESLLAAAT